MHRNIFCYNIKHFKFAEIYSFSAKERDAETRLSYFGSRYYSSDLSVWLSVDPMSDKYPSLSSYNYCANNPVKLVDPKGEEVFLLGDCWDIALAKMQKECSNLVITRGEDGLLNYSYKEGIQINKKGVPMISDGEKKLCDAIDSRDVCVSLTVNNHNSYLSKSGDIIKTDMGGAFLGSEYFENNTADAEQFISLEMANKYHSSKDIGKLLLHEATEAYYGGRLAIANKRNTCISKADFWGNFNHCGDYDYAHDNAATQPSFIFEKLNMDRQSYDKFQNHLKSIQTNKILFK